MIRALAAIAGLAGTFAFAGCGEESGAPAVNTVTPAVGTVATAPPTAARPTTATTPPIGGTHIVNSGDSLSVIADTYQVTMAEIVDLNQWDDGIDHLLFPGDAIELPANAVWPTAPTPTDAAESAEPTIPAAPAQTPNVTPTGLCSSGVMVTTYDNSAGGTIEFIADVTGATTAKLADANGTAALETLPTVIVPCSVNWPELVSFGDIDEPCVDESAAGRYDVQAGQTASDIAAELGVTTEQLASENTIDLAALGPPQELVVCASWFEQP